MSSYNFVIDVSAHGVNKQTRYVGQGFSQPEINQFLNQHYQELKDLVESSQLPSEMTLEEMVISIRVTGPDRKLVLDITTRFYKVPEEMFGHYLTLLRGKSSTEPRIKQSF